MSATTTQYLDKNGLDELWGKIVKFGPYFTNHGTGSADGWAKLATLKCLANMNSPIVIHVLNAGKSVSSVEFMLNKVSTTTPTVASCKVLVDSFADDTNLVGYTYADVSGVREYTFWKKRGDKANDISVKIDCPSAYNVQFMFPSDGTQSSTEPTGIVYSTKVYDSVSGQTAYTSKGSATTVPQITTNAQGQVTGITEVTISGVTPASHAHGNITNDGKLGSTANLAMVTSTGGKIATADMTTAAPSASGNALAFIDSVSQDSKGKISATKKSVTVDSTYSADGTNPVNGKAITDALDTLDVDSVGGSGQYISAISESNGKISATSTSMDTAPTANSQKAVTSGGIKTALDGKQDTLDSQTAYTSKGSATKVPQITTNSLGQVTGITEVTISGVTPTSHSHGELTNDGKIGSTADLAVVTGTSGAVTTANLTTADPGAEGTTLTAIATVSQDSRGKITATKKTIQSASTSQKGVVQLNDNINSTSTTEAATANAVKTAYDLAATKQDKLTAQTAYTSKGTATKVPQITTNSLGQVTGITEVTISGVAPASHTHGNISNGGTLTDTAAAAAENDYVVIRDADNAKIQTSTIKGIDVADAVTKKHRHSNITLSTTAQAYDGSHTIAMPVSDPYTSARTPASHTHGSITNDGKLGSTANLAVVTGTSGAITTSDLTTTAPSASGSALAFIDSVSQDSKGKITASKKNVTIDTALDSSSTNPVQNKAVKTALDKKVDKIIISQSSEYRSFAIIEDITRWASATSAGQLTAFYQMIGELSWWRSGAGYESMDTTFIKYHLNYQWSLSSSNCCEIASTMPEGKIRPMIIKDERDSSDVKYYFGLKINIAWPNTIQFVGRTRSLSFDNITWLPGATSTSCALPSGVTIVKDCSPMAWHTIYSDQLYTAKKLAVNLANTSTDSTFDGSADQTGIKVSGTLAIGNGGTGQTSAKNAANALLPALDPGDDNVIDTDLIIASNHSSGATDTTKFVRRTAGKMWNYVKGKMTSDTGVNISGNAATATSATSAGKLTTARKTYVTLGTASTSTTRDWSGDTTIPVDGQLKVANGGTGSSTAAGARTNLEVYSKSEVDSMLTGRISIVTSLPATGEAGVIYFVGPTGSGSDKYEEYVWDGSAFVKVGEKSIDLSNYVNTLTVSGTGNAVTAISKSGNTITATVGNITFTQPQLGQGYGTCGTAEATAAKKVTLSDFVLKNGGIVAVKFTYALCASATLDVNSTGAKPVLIAGVAPTSSTCKAVQANDIAYFIYDGTSYHFLGTERASRSSITNITRSGTTFTATRADGSTFTFTQQDNNTTYTQEKLGQGYGTCTTAEATAAKVVSLTNYELVTNGVIAVKFTYGLCASATLNVNSKGAKPIYIHGAAVTSTTAKEVLAGDIALFMYDGTQYQFLCSDRLSKDAIAGLSISGKTITYTKADGTTGTLTTQDTTYSFDGTYNSSTNKAATVSTVTNKIAALDVSDISGMGAGKTLATLTETDGKIAATFQNILITKSQVSDFSHVHGNIQNDGTLQTDDVTIASGDKLVITDSSNSSKVARASVSFDGSTTTTALTPKGTFESFAKSSDITSAINALDVSAAGGDGKYIKSISETDGKISATAETMDTTPTASSTKAVTSGGVKTALDAKAPLTSPALTGTPTAPTADEGTSSTQIATTAFVQSAVSSASESADIDPIDLNADETISHMETGVATKQKIRLRATYDAATQSLKFHNISFTSGIWPTQGNYALAIWPSADTSNPDAIAFHGDREWLLDWRPYLIDMSPVSGQVTKKPVAELLRSNWLRKTDGSYAPVVGINGDQASALNGKKDTLYWKSSSAGEKVSVTVPAAFDSSGNFVPDKFWEYLKENMSTVNTKAGVTYTNPIMVKVYVGSTEYSYGDYNATHIPAPWETTETKYSVFIGRPDDVYVFDGVTGDSQGALYGLTQSPVLVDGKEAKKWKLPRTGISPGPITTVGNKVRSFFFNYKYGDSNTYGNAGSTSMFVNNGTYPRTTDCSGYNNETWARACNAVTTNSYPVAEGSAWTYGAFLTAMEAGYGTKYLESPSMFSTGVSSNATASAVNGGIDYGGTWKKFSDGTNGSNWLNSQRPLFQCMEPQIAMSIAVETGVQPEATFTWNGGTWHYSLPTAKAGYPIVAPLDGEMNARIYKVVSKTVSDTAVNVHLRCGLRQGCNMSGDIWSYYQGGTDLVFECTTTAASGNTMYWYVCPDQKKWVRFGSAGTNSVNEKHTDNSLFPTETADGYVKVVDGATQAPEGWVKARRTPYSLFSTSVSASSSTYECHYQYTTIDDDAKGTIGYRSRRRLIFRGSAGSGNCASRYALVSGRPSSTRASVGGSAQVLLG